MRRDVRANRRGDDGALTLSYVLITPIFLTAILIIVQACVWYIAAARQGADVARTAHPPPGRGTQAAVIFARQAAPGFLLAPTASSAGSSAATVTIRVTGRVPSLVPGMVIRVSEVVTAPVEGFTAAGRLVSGRDMCAIARAKAAGDDHLG